MVQKLLSGLEYRSRDAKKKIEMTSYLFICVNCFKAGLNRCHYFYSDLFQYKISYLKYKEFNKRLILVVFKNLPKNETIISSCFDIHLNFY